MSPVKFLTGAPEVDSRNWNDVDAVNDFLPAFRRFLTGEYGLEGYGSEITPPRQESYPKWRSISLEDPDPPRSTNVIEIQDSEGIAVDNRNENEDLEFLEQSIAVFEGGLIQQPPINLTTDLDTSEETTLEETSFFTSTSASLPPTTTPSPIVLPRSITDLRSLRPPHLPSRTITLLVAIISVSAPRTVQPRRRPGTMTLLELLVGDDTAAGFPVTIWLPPPAERRGASDEALWRVTTALRPRDLVLLAEVALGVFGGRVYAQSVRSRTRVVRIGAGGVVRWAGIAESGQTEKVRRVEDWAARFLGGVERRGNDGQDSRGPAMERELPPDTQ